MADVQSAAKLIGRLLVEEAQYLAKVEEKVRELQDELEWMQCFLRDADASQLDNSMARKWVAQIREFAYEAEDTVEKFFVRNRGGGGHDLWSMLKKYSRMFWQVVALHKTGKKIDDLKHKMSLLTAKLHTYEIKLRLEDSSSSWLSKANHETYFTFKEEKLNVRQLDLTDLVGKLVCGEAQNLDGAESSSRNSGPLLNQENGESRVFAICGVGGVGKTFLADEIFNHPEIRQSFDAFAWASISQPCQISAVQQELLSCLTSKSREQIAQMTDEELKDELCKVQRRKKCFIVLDGVWKTQVWDSLKEGFPLTQFELKSKILVTTRLTDVGKHIHRQVVIHELTYLNPDQSKQLFEGKITGALSNLSDAEKKKADALKKSMLLHCGDLPLAIVVLGGVLAAKRTLEEWEAVYKKMSSFSINKEEQPWKRILDLCYYELPYQLKPCFLYSGYFPTNMEISTTKLCRLWEAEGLVSTGDNEDSEETLEDVAESYLAELVERSLVQVGSRDLTGRAKTCRLHDIMQKLCMDKALKVNWLSVVPVGEDRDQPSSTTKPARQSTSASKRKSRRLAIYCSDKLERLPSDYRQASYVRSLLFFNTLEKDDVLIPLKKTALKSTFNCYKLLRVLDIENICVSSLPKDVGNLIHLRYLSLRGSWVSKLPHSIKYLSCLQTLDLRVLSFVRVRIPDVLYRLVRLVHLYLPKKAFTLRDNASQLQLKGLTSLETLSNFSKMCKANDVGTLTNLREFSSCEYLSAPETILPLIGLPGSELVHLVYISLKLHGQYLSYYPFALASCKGLHKLWVKGQVKHPIRALTFPPYNLHQLSLSGCKFQDDPMPVLETLPQLKKLSLEHSAYEGTHMSCSTERFPELHSLTVQGLKKLEEWEVEGGAMPKLKYLEINNCQKLKIIPTGLKSVASLRELAMSYMPLSFYGGWTPDKNRTEWVENWKVEHVPRINISYVLDIQKTELN